MSKYVCRLLTDDGDFFVGYETVVDQFVTRAMREQKAVAMQLGEDEQVIDDPSRIFDLRRAAIHAFTLNLAKLKDGQTLTDSEACDVDRFENFLKGTVAPHQYKYGAELAAKVLVSIVGLGLGDRFPGADWWEMVNDHAMYPAFQNAALAVRFPGLDLCEEPPTPEQNMLAGRYLGYLTEIAGLFGGGESHPVDVVNKFYQMSLMRQAGT